MKISLSLMVFMGIYMYLYMCVFLNWVVLRILSFSCTDELSKDEYDLFRCHNFNIILYSFILYKTNDNYNINGNDNKSYYYHSLYR
jgi:hypothetical protein